MITHSRAGDTKVAFSSESGRLRAALLSLAMAAAMAPGPSHPLASSGHTSDAHLVNSTITGLGGIGGDFEFLDDNGRLRRLSDLRGNVVSVFFGFTNCPDVCPGHLTKASAVRELLDEDKDRFKVVFVTIDPERDDRLTLRNYLRLFGDGNIGARVPRGKLPEVLKLYAASTHHFRDANNNTAITHSIGSYLIDTLGRPTSYVSGNKSAADIVAQVKELLDA